MVNKLGPGTLVVVTGAGSGIGAATAAAFAAGGATVVCADIDADPAEKTAAACEERGGAGRAERCDVTDAAAVAALAGRTGPVDVLVNNAGVGIGAPVAEIETKKLDIQINTNFRSIPLFYRECIDMLRAAGAEHRNALVVNTASIAGKKGQAWLSVYAATKFAVVGWTQSMLKELAAEGIKSTALCPAFVDTPMTDFVKGQVDAADMITPQDIAETVRLLLKVSPACIIPEVQFIRPSDEL